MSEDGLSVKGFIDFLPIGIPFLLVGLVLIAGFTLGEVVRQRGSVPGDNFTGILLVMLLISSPLWGLWLFLKLDDNQRRAKTVGS